MLERQLSARQLAMIAMGGAIGTGLFLGSSVAVELAGPGVILSYAIGAILALLVAAALGEMAVAHPTAGSFGVYAEIYVGRWAGFTVRYSYWFGQVVAMGVETIAAAVYCRWWLPSVPSWFWIVGFAAALVWVNALNVGRFGEFEYWFAMIKVATIVLFLVFGAAAIFGVPQGGGVGFSLYTSRGGFLPHGWKGVWLAQAMVVFSYIGVEVVAVASGEARQPERTIPLALRSMVLRLILFYVGAMAVLVAIVPWDRVGLEESPFVTLFRRMGVPGATHVMNFVVLTAALSSINANLYLVSRTLFSLARGGYAPAWAGRVSPRGAPVYALLASTPGMLAAVFVAHFFPKSAYLVMIGVALFAAIFVWAMIFVTQLRFRQRFTGPALVRMWGYPYTSLLGIALLAAVTLTTWWVPDMRLTLLAGAPWLALVSVGYWVWKRRRHASF